MQIKSIISLAVLAAGLCPSTWGDAAGTAKEETPCPHVQESPEAQENNLAHNQAVLETMRDAARRCSGMAWRVCLVKDGREIAWERYYPFTPEEIAEAREIILTRAHAVKTDGSIQFCGCLDLVSIALCFLDADGNFFTGVEAGDIGMDSDISPDGYLYNAAISMPDADRRFLDNAGNAARRDADIQAFFGSAPEGK